MGMATATLPILQDAPTPAATEPTAPDQSLAQGKLWRPRRVFITPDAFALPHGRLMLERAESYGATVVRLKTNRLTGLTADTEQQTYANAKTSFAIVVSPPSARKLQPIPPSADWQFHLAQGCPAHCQYCYLAGSLQGPPITRAYANLPDILNNLQNYAGEGQFAGTGKVTTASRDRAHEGTTFEASCYTDPLGIEHLTGALAESVRFFGQWDAHVQLRFTTKFDAVTPLLKLDHNRRTRVRFSVNAARVTRDFEGGTANLAQRMQALRRMAQAGYPVGLTVAPIMPLENWREEYTSLFHDTAQALQNISNPDLTIELITHRFTPGSKEVLLGWYPKTTLDLTEANRTEKRNKFGGFKYVYPKDTMADMRAFFEQTIAAMLPTARILYWT